MKLTSAEANKLLRKLNDERNAILVMEQRLRSFVAATVENIEDARPEYSYEATKARVEELDTQIRKIKHAITMFNVTHELPEIGMTIDQVLVYIPQLTEKKSKLAFMRSIPKKQRNMVAKSANLIEYTYANFDIEEIEKDYLAVVDELAKVQNALDLANSTISFEI